MDPINPITNSPQPARSSNGITVLSIALFILLSLGVVGFLYYQNQKLKSMLAAQPTPVSSPTASTAPDETTNWETYIGASKDYSVKYPSGVKADNTSSSGKNESVRFVYMGKAQIDSGRTQTELSDGYFLLVTKLGKASQFNTKTEIEKDYAASKENCNQDNANMSQITSVKVGQTDAFQYSASCMTDYTTTYLSDAKNTFAITQFYTSPAYKKVTDLMLSTFRFIMPQTVVPSTPVQQACTMEAKICPDGTSVGRSGPNCEFSACPPLR